MLLCNLFLLLQISLAAVLAALMTTESSGQNRYVQRGFGQELFGQDGFDLGPKYTVGQAVHAYPQNSGQGYSGLGWNGYQAPNTFNPYQKIGYSAPQSQGFVSGGHLQQGFMEGVPGHQLQFGVTQPSASFVGNRRIRM